jgi:hypothetical protein
VASCLIEITFSTVIVLTVALCIGTSFLAVSAQSPSIAQSSSVSAQSAGSQKITHLSPTARQLAEQLKLVEPIDQVITKQAEYEQTKNPQALIEAMAARQKLLMLLQHAALEVEEALAGIDGDLTINNMLLSYVTSKKERVNNLNNIATFIGSGTFGMLDSGTSIKLPVPTPQIFGLISNSIAVGLPTLALRQGTYKNPRKEATEANTLAPIFGRPYNGATYDPIVWSYIDSVPPDATSNMTRRELLLQRWNTYRSISPARGTSNKEYIDTLVGGPARSTKLSQDVLKVRAELLFDVRALVQLMYKDISEISSMVVEL